MTVRWIGSVIVLLAILAPVGSAQTKKLRIVVDGPGVYWGIDEKLCDDVKADGMTLLSYPECPKIKDILKEEYIGARLMDYNVVIFGDQFYHFGRPDPATGAIPDEVVDAVKQMKKFLEGGGGIWFCGLGEQNWGKTSRTLNYIMKELDLDAEVIGEVVMDTSVMKIGSLRGEYAWVDVARDPLTEGVQNLLHPMGVITSEGSMGVVPITHLGKEWRILLQGGETAASYPLDLTPPTTGDKLSATPGQVKSKPVLCAVRQVGKGRVVLWPTWTNYTITGGSYGMLFAGERDGKKSDGLRFVKNLLYWLAEPAQDSKTVGLFDPKKYREALHKQNPEAILEKWMVPGRKDYANQYKGLVGAHSNLSDGKDSPEQMIAAARKAGYDFIAFTEDLAKMDEAKWNRLLALCDKVNKEDAKFRAFQGLDFLDDAGNRGVVFGHRYWVKEDLRSKKYPDRVEYWYSFAYKGDSDPKRWPPRIIIRSQSNNKRPWAQAMWSLFAPYCYEAGKLVDDSFVEYRPMTGPYGFEWNTGIAVVHTVRSGEEIKAAANPALYQYYVRADQLAESGEIMNPRGVYDSIWTNCGPWRPDPETDRPSDYYPHYFPCYPSTGPEIVDFRSKYLGASFGADMAIEGNNRSLLHIFVRAEAGLNDVLVYDGVRLVRKYKPAGKEFEHFMVVPNNEQHSYTLEITDKAGGRAVSWPAWTHIAERAHMRCGDNWNYNSMGKVRSGQAYKPAFSLLEVTAGWGPKKDPGVARPVYNCYQARWSHIGLGATGAFIFPDHQQLRVDQQPWPAPYYAQHILTDIATAGPYGTVATNLVRNNYRDPKPIPYTTGSFSGPYPVVSSPWPADLKYIYPFSKWNGLTVTEYQGKVRFAQEVSTPDGSPIRLNLGGGDKGNPNILEVMEPGGTLKRQEVGDKTVVLDIPVGGYACWYDDQGDGLGGIIALSPGIQLTYSKNYQGLYTYTPSPAGSMETVKWDLLFVSGAPSTSNSNEQMLDVWRGMGFAGKPALYEVDARVGSVANQRFYLTLASEDGGFRGRIAKTTPRLLPIHLPVWIKGLNPRWDAGIWYKGQTQLEVVDNYRDPWGMTLAWVSEGRYEPRFNELRYLRVLEDGTGYCQVETDKQDPDVFIGNFLVCDQPEVFLGLIAAKPGLCTFEINNPTDRELLCSVRPSQGFDFTGQWQKTIILRSGEMQKVVISDKER